MRHGTQTPPSQFPVCALCVTVCFATGRFHKTSLTGCFLSAIRAGRVQIHLSPCGRSRRLADFVTAWRVPTTVTLAIRLLRSPRIRVAYTGKWTATWHLSSGRQTLSSPRSEAKLRGLRWFWQIYGSEMQPAEAEEFFERARELFGFRRDEIVLANNDRPQHCEPRGDLIC